MLIALTEGVWWNNAHINTSCARAWQRKHMAEIFKMSVKFKIFVTKQHVQFLATPYTEGEGGGGEVGHYTVVAGTIQWLQGRRNSLNRSPQPAVVSTYPHIPKSEPNLIMLVSYMYLFHHSFLYIISQLSCWPMEGGGGGHKHPHQWSMQACKYLGGIQLCASSVNRVYMQVGASLGSSSPAFRRNKKGMRPPRMELEWEAKE